jgi:hypothetical protein
MTTGDHRAGSQVSKADNVVSRSKQKASSMSCNMEGQDASGRGRGPITDGESTERQEGFGEGRQLAGGGGGEG